MSDIFFSYAREDEERVKPIVEALERQGWSVFWDRKIPPGKTFHQHIEKQLDAADCMVVVWSNYSFDSKWVLEEAEEGKNREILVPILIDKVKPPFGFRNIQAADLTAWNHDAGHPQFGIFVNAIDSILPKSGDGTVIIEQEPPPPESTEPIHQPQEPTHSNLPRSDGETVIIKPDPPPGPKLKTSLWIVLPVIMLLLISSLVIYQCKKLSPSTEPPANPANIDSVASKLKLPDNFVLIKGGSFTMGSLEGEYGHQSDETQHTVKLGDFAMCRYEVTVGEYLRFAKETKSHYPAWLNADSISTGNKDFYKNLEEALTGERYPIVGVSWNDAQAYCEWLTKKWKNGRYRLPTEAEWEYACRGGTASPFNTGENLTTVQANYDGNFPYWNNPKGEYRRKTVMVESFKPNDYGLFNMHGNVWEWCHDWYDGKYFDECLKKGIVDNPLGPERGSHRVVRGGSWVSRARYCRSACRNYGAPNIRSDGVGFRLVFVPQVQSTAHPAKM